jgi:hypothetical protein
MMLWLMRTRRLQYFFENFFRDSSSEGAGVGSFVEASGAGAGSVFGWAPALF